MTCLSLLKATSRIAVAAALATSLAAAASAETKSYPTTDFTKLEAKGGVDVIYTTGETASVTVEQAGGDFSDIKIETKSGILEVSRKSLTDKRGWYNRTSVNRVNGKTIVKINGKRMPAYTVTVTSLTLTAAAAANSATLIASGLSADAFDADVSSSGELTLSGVAASATLDASSSGDLMAGDFAVGTARLSASSSADITANLTGDTAQISASSSADVTLVSASPATFEISASSSADVVLSGACAMLDVDISSSADLTAADLTCATARISASSGADVDAYASTDIYARASSGADINLTGGASNLDLKDSSGGDINIDS